MYNIWFCEIIYRDKREPFEIGGLDYLKLIYENIKEEYLKEYAKEYTRDYLGYNVKAIDDRYCVFKETSNFCIFFEELVD